MTVKKILMYPDPRLLKQSVKIKNIDTEVKTIAEDLVDTMYSAEGVGLAAPQIGINKRIFVMDCNDGQEKREYVIVINPEVISSSEELKTYKEGCLSIPEITEEVVRPEKVQVNYEDLSGKLKTEKLDGLWATCFQHELDHLNGKLFIDYLKPIKKTLIKNKIKKLNKKR
ncbi:peptide deformylase [bacterium TMED277]|nr:MAG: peptide deformylase [bacterium TMED277]